MYGTIKSFRRANQNRKRSASQGLNLIREQYKLEILNYGSYNKKETRTKTTKPSQPVSMLVFLLRSWLQPSCSVSGQQPPPSMWLSTIPLHLDLGTKSPLVLHIRGRSLDLGRMVLSTPKAPGMETLARIQRYQRGLGSSRALADVRCWQTKVQAVSVTFLSYPPAPMEAPTITENLGAMHVGWDVARRRTKASVLTQPPELPYQPPRIFNIESPQARSSMIKSVTIRCVLHSLQGHYSVSHLHCCA